MQRYFCSLPRFLARLLAGSLSLRPLLLCLLVLAAFSGAQPTYATGVEQDSPDADSARPFASYMIQLDAEPVVEFYASMAVDQAQSASVNAATQAHLAGVDLAQEELMATLASYDAQFLYRMQRVYNGIAVHAPVDQVAQLTALPGVKGVFPLIAKTPDNARVDQLFHAPALWEGLGVEGLTGKGITIAVIDTGLDYLHTTFGGPGTGGLLNDTNVIGDAPNFPGVKVAGGYDFVGDSYDASPGSAFYQPVPMPDPDPMDCYGFGHGTHVSGTAAGYGVRSDGTTYPGPYDTTINLDNMRIGPGVAPQATLYALKVFGCTGSSEVVDLAVEWAVDPNQDGDFSDHVDVINMSLGSSFGSNFDPTVIAVENAAKLGIIVVTSAGNTGDVTYAIGSPGMATRAIAVAATSIDSSDPDNFADDSVASFSARGPRRKDQGIKPDLAAPGVNIVSARRATGNQAVTSSGTSMASPVVAGVMALLRQAHPEAGTPGWQAQELKALAMNTAVYPFIRADVAAPYSLLRVGAGRIDPTAALQSNLIAYDAMRPEQVSVSFGMVEVLDHITSVRTIRLANKANVPISVTVGYTSVSEVPGVSLDLGISNVITLPAQGFATVPVTLTADAEVMRRHVDPARNVSPPDAYPWLDEVSGYAIFTPVSPALGPAIHLPVLALPRIISAISSTNAPLNLGSEVAISVPLTLTGAPVFAGKAPTTTVPIVGVFALSHSSPPITETPNDDPVVEHYAHADIRYVGTAGPMTASGSDMIYFVIVTYDAWSTPLEVTFQIEIDINGDKIRDFILQNRESTDIGGIDLGASDDFVSLLESTSGIRKIEGKLNVFPPTEYDTRPFANNVMVLPLRLSDLGEDVSRIDYRVVSYSRDVANSFQLSLPVEETPVLTLDVSGAGGVFAELGSTISVSDPPMLAAVAGDTLLVTINRDAYISQHSQALLLVYLHNDLTSRTQLLPVQIEWPHNQFFPKIGH